jgi:hypothetical protein
MDGDNMQGPEVRIQENDRRRRREDKSSPSSPFHHITPSPSSEGEGGWALLGLILALTVLGIVLVSSVTPNYRISVQREKETEMMYRGNQMAEGIARWYNNGFLTGPPQLMAPPAYGHLKELKKLREGVRLGVREIKFVRPSATIDPMSSEEWEPVYARDPRIMPFLQAWSIETGGILSPQLLSIAGPPGKSHRVGSSTPTTPTTPGTTTSGTTTSGTPAGSSGQSASGGRSTDPKDNNPDNDPDDDIDDPLAHLFQGSSSNLPIVAVAPKAKGRSVRALYGLQNYEEWIFLYIPLRSMGGPPQQPPPPNPGGRPRVSQ